MICVSLGRTRHSSFQEGHQYLADNKAQLVELRVDWLRKRPDIGRLLKDRPTAVVVTCRRREDQGRWRGTEEQRLSVLREAIIGGAELVDIEEDIAAKVPRYGDTKRIISYHNFEKTPDDLFDIRERMTQCDADVLKIVTMARTPADNLRVLDLIEGSEKPIVAFCMGEYGILSRILCGIYGSPFTYAAFTSAREMAPGQPSFAEVRNLYRFNKLSKASKVFGVLGDPIGHSLSPLLHNAAFRKIGFDGVYLPLRIPPELFSDTLREFEKLGIEGYSVTIPHKAAACEFADEVDAASERVGAANTLWRRDGQWHAGNTDYPAISDTVEAALEGPLKDKRVLILGAGGVGRAAAGAMVEAGANVVLTNRSRGKAEALAEELGCRTVKWANRGAENCDILINCTSVGMQPNVNESPYEQHWLQENMLVFDTVYTPENTLLLKHAKERGCRRASGLEMFVRQAARQFEIFTGEKAPFKYMVETLRESLVSAR